MGQSIAVQLGSTGPQVPARDVNFTVWNTTLDRPAEFAFRALDGNDGFFSYSLLGFPPNQFRTSDVVYLFETVDGIAQENGLAPFGMFEITGAGAIMGAAGIVYLLLVGRWLLPDRQVLASILPRSEDRHFMAEVLVPLGSPLVGKRLKDAGFTETRGLRVIDLIRRDRSLMTGLDEAELEPGDRVVVRSKVGDMLGLREAGDVAFGGRDGHAIEPIGARETVVMEGVIGPQSRFLARRVADLNLRRLYGAYILAIHRRGEGLSGNFDEVRLQMGDTLLLEGSAESMKLLFDYKELVNLTHPTERPLRRDKAPIAIAALAGTVALAATGILPIAAAAMIAVAVILVTRCIDAEEAWSSIDGNVLVLIFAMLAIGAGLRNAGSVDLIVDTAMPWLAGQPMLVVLIVLYILTWLLTETVTNNAVAVIMTPVAIGLAQELGFDPRPLLVVVMFAASASFATPVGYQTNTIVYAAASYRFADFLKIGVPMNLVVGIVASAAIYWLFPA